MWQRWREGVPSDPQPEQLPSAASEIAYPRAPQNEIRITWVGHASFLIQQGGLNLLTDPHWSQRASPSRFIGPARFVPPGLPFEELPPIDVVVLSHDHYDHLDDPTVRRIVGRAGNDTTWVTPEGYRDWLTRRGANRVIECEWWKSEIVTIDSHEVTLTALPAQHWSRRGLADSPRSWSSWLIKSSAGSVYFGGDSGYFGGYAEIGRRLGPPTASLLPIGAYDPRWFMKQDHMNPEEAVQAFVDMGGEGYFIPMHWGTFRLTDEDPLEPPIRARQAWKDAGLPADKLWVPDRGQTLIIRPRAD